jgi:hypothetical protein
MRRFTTIVMSVLFLYAGVAWAFEGCSLALERSDFVGTLRKSDHTTPTDSSSSEKRLIGPSTIIHCLRVSLEIGPVIESLQARFSRHSSDGMPLKVSAPQMSKILLDEVNEYPLKFFSFRSASISFPQRSSVYAFVGVFRI